MKKAPYVAIIASIFAIYLTILGFAVFNRENAALPEAVNQQILMITEGELVSGSQKKSVTLPVHFDVADATRLEFTLNYSFSGRTVPSLILQANHTFLTIRLDGEELFHVEPKPYSLGNYFTHIPLPQRVNGARLEIQIAVPPNGLSRIEVPELIIANEAVFLKQQVLRDIPSLLLNALILFSGIMLLLLALVGRKSIDPYRMLLRGFLALNCAAYFMCETFTVVFLAPRARTIYIMDMLSFAALAPLLLILLGWGIDDWRGKLLKAIAGLGVAGIIAQVGLALLGGVELRRLLPLTQGIQAIGIVAMIVCFVYGLIRKKNSNVFYVGGLVALCGAVDLILFLCEIGQDNVLFMRIGLLIYLFYEMYQFVRLLMKHSAEKARENYYKALAMQDSLSCCYSRAAFEVDRDTWDGKTVRTAFIVDLNNIKITNDLYGHSAGDQLIRALGNILSSVFLARGKCYRIGGDEFWMFCDDLGPGQSDEMIHAIQQAADAYNRDSDSPFRLSYAVGVCHTGETQGNLNQAIEVADARMYENKHAMKQAAGPQGQFRGGFPS